ncbi:hypothetical protein [Gordonia insulae]|uniref:Uncharacterized protein n=1 Tax=Gordonia insulae TaxID=2420509 RepID=A0A3G8JTT9_9ACTN|nr:hypothetical protein [Gordonia insulae]AZG47952.1 hypothetical protein D7316_04564 [Gordonia insulae]
MRVRRWVHRFAALSATSMLVLAGSAMLPVAAGAAPGDTAPPLSLKDVGSSSTITIPGQQGEFSLTLPVPAGLTPQSITGTTAMPAFVTGGFIDVVQDDRTLSRTPVSATPNARIELPLRGVRVARNAADLTLRTYLRADGFCKFDPEDALRITNATITYGGRESAPTAVADFLQPVLRKLTIYVPDDVQQAEGAAAVDLATAVIANYGTAPVEIETRSLPRDALTPTTRPGALERQIVVATGDPAGLSLQNGPGGPFLRIGGDASNLEAQAQFLTSDLSPIALSSAAVAGTLHDAPQLPPDVVTLADLGVSDQTVTSASWPSLTIGIDQTRLGRPSKDVRVQLHGSYTPAPQGSGGRVAVRVGDRVIDSWETDSSGVIDQWVQIPDDLLSRYTELRVTLERGDTRAQCGDGYQTDLSLDSTGEVTSSAADPPQPSGFQSLPQALMPRTQVAWTTGDVADVRRAVTIMSGMQRLSAIPLGIDVVDMSAVTDDQPAVLISGDGTGLPQMSLPVTSDGSTVRVLDLAGNASTVTLTPTLDYASLQVARSDGQTRLVATSTDDPAELDQTLAWLDADTDRWSQLSGDAMLQVGDRDPVFVTEAAAPEAESSSTGAIVGGVIAAVAVVAAAAVVAWTLLRRRRARSS